MIYFIAHPDGLVELTDFEFEALWTLLPDYCPPNPMRGKWERDDKATAARRRMFALALIDCDGNVTAKGIAICNAIAQDEADAAEAQIARLEMRELDELDRRCRRRPRQRRYDG